METLDVDNIKYYPDKFYICLDGFDLNRINSFLSDGNFNEQHSIFIHEYYHYLTNVATYAGVRQFNGNFIDKYKIINNVLSKHQLNAFPLKANQYEDCQELIENNRLLDEILKEDDLDRNLIKETDEAPLKSFEIANIRIIKKAYGSGTRDIVEIEITGLLTRHRFILSLGALDEFFSSTIDEFMIEYGYSIVDPRAYNKRPFYPYRVYDKIISYYLEERFSSLEKILLIYVSLNSNNPPVHLVNILSKIQIDGYDIFSQDPEKYINKHIENPTNNNYLLNVIDLFAKQASLQGRNYLSKAINYFYDIFYMATSIKKNDYFFFIRPFIAQENKEEFLNALSRIVNIFTPPVMLVSKEFHVIDKLTDYGDSVTVLIASHEIIESLKNNRLAKRLYKNKYLYPDKDLESDNIETFEDLPKKGNSFQIALNELGLFELYINEKNHKDI
ncbi:hypothetical protein [Spirosoma terrae]|uniref:Uncharacterized protein n=1 Tax=Spirosoma terrae TaxID=1968276 RepID=A0A6L9LKB9_9BACT|nr:hypothetical protein [Spirosoma terrae]NDU99248.1 hypothetical protein [Spirosoma terrae]